MLHISSRINDISESITLKFNALAVEMSKEGKKIFNLTAGQLPFRPPSGFINLIRSELDFLRSFQYCPVGGIPELRESILSYFEKTRGISTGGEWGCIISNGAKHSISNVLCALVEPGDEVIILSPYWVSYPEVIKLYGGVPVVVNSNYYDSFTPSISEIKRLISARTRAVIINSPNNPVGVHYNEHWMERFAQLLLENPKINVISDEIYYHLCYFDPKPIYFYQIHPELLERTIIIDGISKSLASTGLRIGWALANNSFIRSMIKLQGQTTSGANSVVQSALAHFGFSQLESYLKPIRDHLRDNSILIKDAYQESNIAHLWYQSTSAFYYLVNFNNAPIIQRYRNERSDQQDFSFQLCEDMLNKIGVSVVPGTPFGIPNSFRISLVLDRVPFAEAIRRIVNFIS